MATVARAGAGPAAVGSVPSLSAGLAVFSGYGIGFSQGSVLTAYFKLAIFTLIAAYWVMAFLPSTFYHVYPRAFPGNHDLFDFHGAQTT
jgi:hypothetical protein